MNFLTETVEFPNLFSGDISINNVAFSIGGSFNVYWYAIIIALGLFLGFIYAQKRAEKVGLISDNVFDVAFISAFFGFIGARAYFCIFQNLSGAANYNIITMFTEIHDGGLGIYGGIIAAVITAIICCKIKKMPLLPLLDLAGPAFLIGQAIGRWGNFINQECYGAPTAGDLPWGMTGSIISKDPLVVEAQANLADGAYALVHPCFLYESLWCVVGFLLIHFVGNKFRSFDGECFLYYVLWYGAGRAWIEGLRTDSLYAGELKISQVVAIASAIFALILIVFYKIYFSKKEGYKLYMNTEISADKLAAYKLELSLEKDKAAAKKALKKAEKEKNAPVAPSILGDEEQDTTEETEEKTDENKSE